MKALRYLLIVIAMVSVLGVSAQTLAQMPKAQMKSTSGMVFSGSQLPSAAERGTYVTGTTVGTYSPANASGPNRAKKDEWEDDPDPDNPGEPAPLGDAALPLALLACAYVLFRYVRTRKRA
jgi:hypothetical protein